MDISLFSSIKSKNLALVVTATVRHSIVRIVCLLWNLRCKVLVIIVIVVIVNIAVVIIWTNTIMIIAILRVF